MTAYSPSGPRNPVRGVRCPMRIASACPRLMAGNPSAPMAAVAAPALMSARRPLFVESFMAPPRFIVRETSLAKLRSQL